MIKRDFYLKRLIHNIFSGEIKVITGICRCGKSVLLFELFYDYLLGQGVREEQILKIELDQRRYYKYGYGRKGRIGGVLADAYQRFFQKDYHPYGYTASFL